MNDINRLLGALAEDESQVNAPRRLEDAVMAAWDEAHRESHQVPARRPLLRAARVLMPVAAGMVLLAGFGIQQVMLSSVAVLPALPVPPSPAIVTPAPPVAAASIEQMVPVPVRLAAASRPRADAEPATMVVLVGEPIRAGEGVRVVRMRMPVPALSMMGIRTVSASVDDRVDVDVLVGEDGVARALRVGM